MAAEKNFENRVKKYLEEKGCWYIKYWGRCSIHKSRCSGLVGVLQWKISGSGTESPKRETIRSPVVQFAENQRSWWAWMFTVSKAL